MSALPPKADMCSAAVHVCFGPIADMTIHFQMATADVGLGQKRTNDKSILKPQVDGERGPPLDTYTRGATFSLIAIILASAAVLAGSYIGGE
jgi:hypothetical protein